MKRLRRWLVLRLVVFVKWAQARFPSDYALFLCWYLHQESPSCPEHGINFMRKAPGGPEGVDTGYFCSRCDEQR